MYAIFINLFVLRKYSFGRKLLVLKRELTHKIDLTKQIFDGDYYSNKNFAFEGLGKSSSLFGDKNTFILSVRVLIKILVR